MEITTISRLILRRWWLLALPVAVCFVAAVVGFINESGTGDRRIPGSNSIQRRPGA